MESNLVDLCKASTTTCLADNRRELKRLANVAARALEDIAESEAQALDRIDLTMSHISDSAELAMQSVAGVINNSAIQFSELVRETFSDFGKVEPFVRSIEANFDLVSTKRNAEADAAFSRRLVTHISSFRETFTGMMDRISKQVDAMQASMTTNNGTQMRYWESIKEMLATIASVGVPTDLIVSEIRLSMGTESNGLNLFQVINQTGERFLDIVKTYESRHRGNAAIMTSTLKDLGACQKDLQASFGTTSNGETILGLVKGCDEIGRGVNSKLDGDKGLAARLGQVVTY